MIIIIYISYYDIIQSIIMKVLISDNDNDQNKLNNLTKFSSRMMIIL